MREGWETVVCVASGPSFDDDQARQLNEAHAKGSCRLLVVNDNYRRLPDADAMYACDYGWWLLHEPTVQKFAGEKWTQDLPAANRWGLYLIEMRSAGRGLSTRPGVIHAGGNSGYQAVNLAYHFGAKHIVLVGYDMQASEGKAHWFGDHPDPLCQITEDIDFASWRTRFKFLATDLFAQGVRVTNCSKQTALTCVERATLEETL